MSLSGQSGGTSEPSVAISGVSVFGPLVMRASNRQAPKSSSAARMYLLSCENSPWWPLPSGGSKPVSGSNPSYVESAMICGFGGVGHVHVT